MPINSPPLITNTGNNESLFGVLNLPDPFMVNDLIVNNSSILDGTTLINDLTALNAEINGNLTVVNNTISSNLTVANANITNLVSETIDTNNLFVNNLSQLDGTTLINDLIAIDAGVSGTLTITGNLLVSNKEIVNNSNIVNLTVSSGEIYMVDNNDQYNLLHTIDANLYFNNELLAKANDIQDIADWALYPALQDVNMDNKQLLDVLNITPVDITDTNASQGTAGQVLFKSTPDNNMVWGDLPTPPETVSSLNLLTGNVAITSTGNTVIISNVGQNINLETATPPPAGVASLNSVTGAVTLTSNGSVTITPSGQNIQLTTAVADVSRWSTFDAINNVNLNGNQLTDGYGIVGISANKITGGVVNVTAGGGNDFFSGFHGTVNINADSGTAGALTTGGLINLTANSGFNDVSFTSAIKMSAAGINSYAGAVPSVGSLAGYNFIYGTAGVNLCCGLPSIIPNIPFTTYLYGTNGIVLNSDVYTTNLYPYWNGIAPPTNLSINGRATISGRGYVFLNNVDSLNFESAVNGGTGAITGLQSINGVPYNGSYFIDAYQIYVAPNGNDTQGDGSQQNPFLTIAKAITQRATITDTVEVSIIISSGTYTFVSITLTRNTYLVGVQTGEARQPVNITGNIILNDTTGSMGISGLEVVGNVSMTGLGGNYTVFGCNISNSTTAISATTGTVFITECRVSSTSGTTLNSSATTTIRDCNISTSGTGACVIGGASTTIRQSVIQSSSASTGVQPLVNITNANTASIEIGFCKLEYLSTVTDVTGNKCCIKFAGTGIANASVYDCLLLCEGAITGGASIDCIQDTGAGAVNISYGQLIAGATAHHISSNSTKTQYTSVP
jgi:hypothetical protein